MSFAKYIENLETSELQLTTIRTKLLQELFESKKPLTSDELVMKMDRHGVSAHRATIYRDLDYFVENNIVSILKIVGEKARLYELNREHRHHFKCMKCGSIGVFSAPGVEKELAKLEKTLKKQNGWLVQSHSLKLYGLCKTCNKNDEK